ncbi:MAG: hypothetical protein ACTHK7_21335 [Aureliella sp.]
MAACQLVIALDDSSPRSDGAPITGTIIVRAEKDVNCKGLVARCYWSTHGRGNIDSGEVDKQTLFEGTWQAGQEYRYPFKLNTATWPPTYYGTYVSVGHFVEARAKLSWATDPKATVEFPVAAATAPDDLKPTTAPAKAPGVLGWVIGGIIIVAVLAAFGAILIFLLPIILLIAGLVWFFKVFLPKRITGPVACELKAPRVAAGDVVEAQMTFTPQRSSTINGIEWTISCVEECSSGSGSNRQTHRHEVLKEIQRASDTLRLNAGQTQTFDFRYQLPQTAPPSLKFYDNHVKWNIVGRIDIPSWPDWTKTLPVVVSPNPAAAGSLAPPVGGFALPGSVAVATGVSPEKTQADEEWFRQVIQQIEQTQHDHEQLAIVIGAVRDFEFQMTATIEDEIDTPEFEDETEFERLDEYEWWAAFCPAQNVSLALAWRATPPTIHPGLIWTGSAVIVGYDVDSRRILMEVMR